MFTPPPSPLPSRAPVVSAPPELKLATAVGKEPEYPFPHIPSPSPKSPCIAEAGPSRIPLDVKKRSGRRTLVFIALLPAALILTASLRHFIRVPTVVNVDKFQPVALQKRDPQGLEVATSSGGTATPTSSSLTPTTSVPLSPSVTPTSTTALPTVPTSDGAIPTPFPQPFDASLSANFSTQGCQDFFANFTQDLDFRQCRAFSFLLNTSSAFLQAQRNLTLINNIIWGTCNTPPTEETCNALMADQLMQLNSVCKDDITAGNPVALQAQVGFESYTAMRTAACLSDASTNSYCYTEAVAASPPADIYFYALPLGTPLPNGTKPSCSPCVQSVLAVYAQYVNPSVDGSGTVSIGSSTGNSTASAIQALPLPILSKTYPGAARVAQQQCGRTFASVGVAQPSGAHHYGIVWGAVMVGLILGSWSL
ncbi:hypothetical protein K439DRAFT_1636274 [Ramaria rubella]|nr:hypothetical protein K439DRAFT_1636274 [Ramaria rubella]